jgi:cytochrome b
MVVALLALAAAAGASGWLSVTARFWGVKWVQELHEALANALYLFVGLHLAGVVFTSLRQRENLVRAMLSGSKPAPRPGDVD